MEGACRGREQGRRTLLGEPVQTQGVAGSSPRWLGGDSGLNALPVFLLPARQGPGDLRLPTCPCPVRMGPYMCLEQVWMLFRAGQCLCRACVVQRQLSGF